MISGVGGAATVSGRRGVGVFGLGVRALVSEVVMGASTGDRKVARTHRSNLARLVTLTVVAMVAVAGCGGGDDDTTPTDPTVTPSSAAPPTTAPQTTTTETVASTTTGVATTTSATTTPSVATITPATTPIPSTSAPATTAPAKFSDEAALAVLEGYFAQRRECVRSIPDCDTSAFDEYLMDPQLSGDRQQISEWQAASYFGIDGETLTYEVLELRLDASIPHIVICQRDGGSLVERRPGEPDRVIDGGYVEKIREAHFRRTADGWRIEGFATRTEAEGEPGALCDS